MVEFLLAVLAVFTLWSQVGGQYHLDLMFWPWKLGLGLGAAGLITAISAQPKKRRVWALASLLLLVMVVAGLVTYYYHNNEPPDDNQDDSEQTTSVT